MLDADRRAERPVVLEPGQLHVAVHRHVAPAPRPGGHRPVAEESVGPGREALAPAVGADRPRLGIAGDGLVLLVAPLRAGRDVDHVGGGVGQVGVEADVPLPVAAQVERGRRVRAERRIDRVADEEVRLVRAERSADVPVEAVGSKASDAAHQRQVLRLAAEAGREAARKQLAEREAVRVVEDLLQGDRVGRVVGDRHRGAVRRPHPAGQQRVADQQRLAAVDAVDPAPRVRVAKEEAAGHPLAGVVGVAVDLHAGRRCIAEVPEQLQVVVDVRRAPDLRRVGRHVGVAGRAQGDGVAAGRGAVGRLRAAILQAEIGEAGGAQRQTGVGRQVDRLAAAVPEPAGVVLEGAARAGVLELEVHHAGDGVRAVLRRRAVPQHLDLQQCDGRDGRDVGPLRAERHAVAAVPVDDRRAVAALAVHEHQRVVRGQVAQHRRPDHGGRVADRLGVDGERRDDRPELVLQVDGPLAGQLGGGQHVHRYRRRGHRPRLRAGADDDRLLAEPGQQVRDLLG